MRPGHILTFDGGNDVQEGCYWDIAAVARSGLERRVQVDDREAVDALNELLRDAVARRMVADVPLGAFLSGGIDSSTVVALMQAQSSRPVRTFSIGFNEKRFDEVYPRLVSHWALEAELVPAEGYGAGRLEPAGLDAGLEGEVERMQLMDLRTYLPSDILAKVDRASMAFSLEARVPLLDHRVVEHAWCLPGDRKIRSGETKWILRRVLGRYVPRTLFERPKMGFAVPIDRWLRGPLRDWATDLLHLLEAFSGESKDRGREGLRQVFRLREHSAHRTFVTMPHGAGFLGYGSFDLGGAARALSSSRIRASRSALRASAARRVAASRCRAAAICSRASASSSRASSDSR